MDSMWSLVVGVLVYYYIDKGLYYVALWVSHHRDST